MFFVAGLPKEFAAFAGQARVKIGDELGLTAKDQFAFCWIVDFPMYEWNEEEGKIDFSHNPFSMPQGGLEALETKEPEDILAYQYDVVCNGVELSSGAIRNHKPEIMEKAFAIAGYPKEELEKRFGGMLQRPAIWRAAPWRHRARHRPHRHAALRRGEFAAGGHVPDEPAGGGPADGRAVRGLA